MKKNKYSQKHAWYSGDVKKMLRWLDTEISPDNIRKFNALAKGFIRTIWFLLDEESQALIELSERYFEGLETKEKIIAERKSDFLRFIFPATTDSTTNQQTYSSELNLLRNTRWAAYFAADATKPVESKYSKWLICCNHRYSAELVMNVLNIYHEMSGSNTGILEDTYQQHHHLLLEIFGDVTNSIKINPDWLKWNDGCVVKMANQIMLTDDLGAIPVLTDALEDAGCNEPSIINHLRFGENHSTHCWALNLLAQHPHTQIILRDNFIRS